MSLLANNLTADPLITGNPLNWLCTTFQILTERESASTTIILFLYEIDQLLRIICIKKFSYITLSRKHRHVCPFFTAVEAYVFNLVFQHMLLHPGFSFNSSRLPKSLFRCFEQSSLLTIEKAIFQLWSQCPLCVNRRKIQELQHFPILKAFSELANGLPSFIHHIETSGIFRLQSNQSCKSF